MKSRTFVGDFNGACANMLGAAIPRSGIAAPSLRMVRRVTSGFFLLPNSLSLTLFSWFRFVSLPVTRSQCASSHVRHFALLDVPALRRPALVATRMIADILLDVFRFT